MQRNVHHRQSIRSPLYFGSIAAIVVGTGFGAHAIITNLVLVSALHAPQATHVEQTDLVALVQNNQTEQAFAAAFEQGDTLFATVFNAVDGVGANVGQGQPVHARTACRPGRSGRVGDKHAGAGDRPERAGLQRVSQPAG
jgi:hypothetical protein